MIHFCPFCGNDLSKISSEEKQVPQNQPSEVVGTENVSILDSYEPTVTESGVEIAKPRYLDNKDRLMRLRNRPMPIVKVKRMDTEMDQFGDLVVGSGLQQED